MQQGLLVVRSVCTFIFLLHIPSKLNAQSNILDTELNFESEYVTTTDILNQLSEKGITFTFKVERNAIDENFRLYNKNPKLKDVLNLLSTRNLSYKIKNNCIIIKSYIPSFSITGFVYDKNSGEQLINANIICSDQMIGSHTNNYGFYNLNLVKGQCKVRFSYIGYKSFNLNILLHSDTLLNVYLEPNEALNEISIKGNKQISNNTGSHHFFSAGELESKMLNLGENDLLKTIQLLPGIQPSIGGTTGLQIRGGTHSQNSIQIDGVSIYNTDHAFGLNSVFNSDAIKSVELIKGGFPARYGGKVSSILNIRMNEGNNRHFRFKYSANLLSSKFMIEGPILKKKTSFMFSARKTHFSKIFKLQIEDSNAKDKFGYYDIYAKIKHKINEKSYLYASAFYGKDAYHKYTKGSYSNNSYLHDSRIRWINSAYALRWNYFINEKFFINTKLTYGVYSYRHKNIETKNYYSNGMKDLSRNENFNSGINDLGFNIDVDLPTNEKHYFRFGAQMANRNYKPFSEGRLTLFSSQTNNHFHIPTFSIAYDSVSNNSKIGMNTISGYFEDDYNITQKLSANLGFRYNVYFNSKVDYHTFEPRLLIRYSITKFLRFNLAYSKMSQNTLLLSNSFLIMPFHVWVPSTQKIKPMHSEQVSTKAYFSISSALIFSIEGYFKTIENDILYKSWNRVNNNSTWENYIEQGKKRAYGLEILLEKKSGKISGWATYALTKTERQFQSINKGRFFPFWLVRKHKLSATINFKLFKVIELGASWTYSSGIPKNTYYQELAPVVFQDGVSNPNPFTDSWSLITDIPSYHKLDLGLKIEIGKRNFRHSINLGVNNIYKRNNPLLISEYDGNLYLASINLFMPYFQYVLCFR